MAAWALGLLCLLPDVGEEVQRALERSGISRDGLGLAVGRAGEPPLLAVGWEEPRIPASNQKILTAAAALRRLGREFRFETRVARGARGELVVVGDGDPNLSGRWFDGDPTRVLRLMAADVKARGIDRVGDLVLDASRFDGEMVHPDWPADQLDRWYCAPVAALVYNDSCWDITVRPGGRAGDPARVEVQPALLRPSVLNRCETAGEGEQHLVHLARAAEADLAVHGRILLSSSGITGNVAVRDPVLFFGRAFRAALEAEGVAVEGALRVGRVEGAKDLLVYRSGLDRTLEVMLRNSQNLYAECLFKRAGDGTFRGGGEAVAAALREMGVPTEGLVASDGSGLARTNRVSARTLYGVLQALRDEPHFVQALPAGGEGTLRRRYAHLGARLRAKTGYIRGVSALSGYVTGGSGTRYVFTVLANGRSTARARRLQDLLVEALGNR